MLFIFMLVYSITPIPMFFFIGGFLFYFIQGMHINQLVQDSINAISRVIITTIPQSQSS